MVKTSYTRVLEKGQADRLEALLRDRGYEFREVPHARFAADRPDVKVVMYASGKLVVQGKGVGEFVEFVLEPEVLGQAEMGYEIERNPELGIPRLGVDESGKGDLFGPLCVAGVYANERIVRQWMSDGVRDSKSVHSDRAIADLARRIRGTPGCVFSVVPIGNAAYNRLYAKFRNVNSLLAWGHARVIENLIEQGGRMDPRPQRAVVDQFAASESTVRRALMAGGKGLELVQRHRAEADPVVAAASILARDEFVARLAGLGKEYGLVLPKGASGAANVALAEFVKRHGKERLAQVAKLHFRNVANVAGV